MFFAIFGIVFFASVAMMVREGIWSNTITLVNVLLSGLIAFGFYSPLAIWIDETLEGTYTYFVDFLSIWILYVVAMICLRIVTDRLSTTRLRLKHPFDSVGGPVMAVLAAWALATFVMATLHAAPLAKESLGGKLVHSEQEVANKSAITAPDLAWIRFVGRVASADGFGYSGAEEFSPSKFVSTYADHRAKLDAAGSLRVNR